MKWGFQIRADLPCEHLLWQGRFLYKWMSLFLDYNLSSKRRWYNGEHSCPPSSWPGFDSRATQLVLAFPVKQIKNATVKRQYKSKAGLLVRIIEFFCFPVSYTRRNYFHQMHYKKWLKFIVLIIAMNYFHHYLKMNDWFVTLLQPGSWSTEKTTTYSR